MKKPILMKVEGTPRTWGTGNSQIEWRKRIRDECKKYYKKRIKINKEDYLGITIRFCLKKIKNTDLDNLAKPVLDTICYIKRCQIGDKSLTGTLFDCDDNRVQNLILKKEPAEGEKEFIEIKASIMKK
ncbi:RusA family crossover junction endodeoxyribonuclease [Candidatus Woesearchaeota archaeon]|nr:RusA family crossover junction endodeoxyribonuclease [Candidatus Woesearchaeota archaeon]